MRPGGPLGDAAHGEGIVDQGEADSVRADPAAPEARERGLFRTDYADRLLADPNTHRTTLGSNQLWQVGLLELWLQEQGIR